MAKIDVKVPDIGDFKDVPVIEVLVKPGDVVKVDQSLITLESDKATMDVPSPAAGRVAEIVAKVGDKVSMGTLIARLDEAAGEAPKAAAQAAPAKAAAPPGQGGDGEGSADRHRHSRHRRFQGRAGDRDSGEGRRHGRGRAADRDARKRQGDDGRALAGGRQNRQHRRQGRRQGLDGFGDREARRRRTGRGCPAGPGGRGGGEGRGGRGRGSRNLARLRRAICRPRRPRAPASPALADFTGVFAGPAVRRLARELGLDLNQIKGTGEKGRITREDVKAALAAPGAAAARRRGRFAGNPGRRLRQIRAGRDRCRSRASSAFPGRACMRRG